MDKALANSVNVLEVTPSKSRFERLKIIVKLTWFLTISIAALSLSVAVAFSGYDPTTSNVAISSVKPLKVINSLVGFIGPDGSISNSSVSENNSTATAEMLEPFALDVLPYEYRFGMAGICRLYNTSTLNTTCTRSLGNTPSVLSVLTTDLNSTRPDALANWVALFDAAQAAEHGQSVSPVLLHQLTHASSALLLTSISLSPFEIALTLYLFFKTEPHNFRKSLFLLYILDGLMMLASATLYTGCIYSIGSYKIEGDISPNFGFILFWCAGAGKFLVTPTMFIMSLFVVIFVTWYTTLFATKAAIATGGVIATDVALAGSGGNSGFYVGDYGGDSGF